MGRAVDKQYFATNVSEASSVGHRKFKRNTSRAGQFADGDELGQRCVS